MPTPPSATDSRVVAAIVMTLAVVTAVAAIAAVLIGVVIDRMIVVAAGGTLMALTGVLVTVWSQFRPPRTP